MKPSRLQSRRGAAYKRAAASVSPQTVRVGRVMDLQGSAVRRVTRVLAWLCLAYIAFITVGPIGVRPETGFSPRLERLVAFMVVGALFAAAYPRHIVRAALVVISSALLLEALQVFEPSRHGRLFDASVKIVGGMIGLGAGWLLARLTRRTR